MFSAILFDLDGTLIRTVHLYEQACIEAMRRHDLTLTPKLFSDLYPRPSSLEEMIREVGGDVALTDQVRAVRDDVYVDLLADHTEWLSGAQELLKHMQHVPMGIITGSRKRYCTAINKRLEIIDYVDVFIDQDDMDPYYKPHPHGLNLACMQLQVEPEDCVYIGDQPFDIAAANTAGMKSVLIRGEYTPKEMSDQPDAVFEGIGEARDFILNSV